MFLDWVPIWIAYIIVYDGEYMEDCFTGTDDIVTDNSIYYWSVTAVDQSGATTDNSGGFHSFIVNTENDAPIASSLISPSDGSVQSDLTPHFIGQSQMTQIQWMRSRMYFHSGIPMVMNIHLIWTVIM